MKNVLNVVLLTLLSSVAYSYQISHSDYVSGAAITATGQNTNENTIVNVINGNLDTTNLSASAGLKGTQMAANTITYDLLSANVQSTFTYVNNFSTYRRPVLQYVANDYFNVENNDGVANKSCIHFPDGFRCVTENLGSSTNQRRCDLTRSASLSGTKLSGMAPGETRAANTWYSVYAAKATDSATDFVLVATTNTPTQANVANLNSIYGTNGWVYLGLIRNGDNANSANIVLGFKQVGNRTTLFNNNANSLYGIIISSTAGATQIIYTYAAGTNSNKIPPQVGFIQMTYDVTPGLTQRSIISYDSAGTDTAFSCTTNGTYGGCDFTGLLVPDNGTKITNSTSGGAIMSLNGWVDGVLGVGFNPQI